MTRLVILSKILEIMFTFVIMISYHVSWFMKRLHTFTVVFFRTETGTHAHIRQSPTLTHPYALYRSLALWDTLPVSPRRGSQASDSSARAGAPLPLQSRVLWLRTALCRPCTSPMAAAMEICRTW